VDRVARIRKSRNGWKSKAVSRGSQIRDLRKKLDRMQKRLQYKAQISRIGTGIASAIQLPVPIQIIPWIQLRTVCVMMVIRGIVCFRAVPRILRISPLLGSMQIQVVPHFTSVIHWSLRAGLALFEQVSILCEPWLAIIDCSIDVGTRKALVVLRVPLSALSRKQGAIGLEDCQCIGLKISSQWNGEQVKNALMETFAQAGMPRAIIKDGGTDLNKGVRLYRETEGAKTVWGGTWIGFSV